MADSAVGPVAVITGGGSGIGKATAELFAGEGFRAAVLDIRGEEGERTADGIRRNGGSALALRTDVRSATDVRTAIDRVVLHYGRIDMLCNNAGIECYRRAHDYTADEFTAIVDTNLRGPFLCTKYAYPHLRERKGSVVNVSSVQAFANESRISVYAAAKAGLLALTRGMALDFASDGVRVNAVCPGAIRTGMFDARTEATGNRGEPGATLEGRIPLGRVGEPEAVARTILFLASSAAGYVTGTALVVDGGLLCRLASQ